MKPIDALPYDLLTPEERRAMMRVGTHTEDGERLAEWERLYLATVPPPSE